jgi:hypothetical protein
MRLQGSINKQHKTDMIRRVLFTEQGKRERDWKNCRLLDHAK